MAPDDAEIYEGEDELVDFQLREELANIYAHIYGIHDRLDNFVTKEQLAKAKSDLTWRFVTWSLGFVACIVTIVGVVIAALSYLSD